MKYRILLILLVLSQCAPGATVTGPEFIAEAEKMADAQLAALAGKKPEIGWVPAVMWAGITDLSHASSKDTYSRAIERLGNSVAWTPGYRSGSPWNADDLCICQTFLDSYISSKQQNRLVPSQSRIAAVSDHILKDETPFTPGAKDNHLTWWWCDALFMAPAPHARLSLLTGNPTYINAMDREWWKTSDLLYDPDEHLFYRDEVYLKKRDSHGKKIFWSRGNGWVFAGLARTLEWIPRDYPSRGKYVTMFKEMAARLGSLQQSDGTWPSSLLDPAEIPGSEASGTALNCFALAWGINHGILNRDTALPQAARAWAALMAGRRPDGLPGYVQPTGKDPAPFTASGTQLYATGACLMAACQLAQLAPISIPEAPPLTAPPPSPSSSALK